MKRMDCQVDKQEITLFYDGFTEKLINDFIRGNPRFNRAVDKVCSQISASTRHILDVGCGIGASSYYYARHSPQVQVVGVDISPNNIATARRLFGTNNLEFKVSDLSTPPRDHPFDMVVMLDLYEHIPRKDWPGFNRVIKSQMDSVCTVVLTTPSVAHQEYLHRENPSGLQVVDETVTLPDLVQFADDIDAKFVSFEHVSIWRKNDYVHCLFQRGPAYAPIDNGRNLIISRITRRLKGMLDPRSLIARSLRKKVVQSRLGIFA